MNVENRTFFCKDNIDILSNIDSQSMDMVYLDPPFNKNKSFIAPIGTTASGASFKDIPTSKMTQKEKTGYPTQKPLALLERIILNSTKEGNFILDPFCGCATALVVAEKLKRKWGWGRYFL